MRINWVVTVDVDNDGCSLENQRNAVSWRAVGQIAPLKEAFDRVGARATWFVRADNQLADLYGAAAYLWTEYAPLWRQLADSGDEIAWHPHLYERTQPGGFYQPDTNPARCAARLSEIHSALGAAGIDYRSVRLGEAFHSNETMRALSDLGLEVDSTAIPGRKRHDRDRRFDWEPTPNEPYHPSPDDYRVAAADRRLPILEVPMTTIPTQADYDSEPRLRYANLAFRHDVFKAGLDTHLENVAREDRDEAFLTTILHPDETVAADRAHPLYAFSLAETGRNLGYLLEAVGRRHWRERFLTTSEVADCFARRTGSRANSLFPAALK